MGILLRTMNLHNEAISSHELSLGVASNAIQKAQAWEQKAYSLFHIGELDEAREAIENAIRMNPFNLPPYLQLVAIAGKIQVEYRTNDMQNFQFWNNLLDELKNKTTLVEVIMEKHKINSLSLFTPGSAEVLNEFVANSYKQNDELRDSLMAITMNDVANIDAIRNILMDINLSIYDYDLEVLSNGMSDGYYAMFKIYCILLEYDVYIDTMKQKLISRSWASLVKANSIEKHRNMPYDQSDSARKSATLSAVFIPGFWPVGVGYESQVPLFIVGMIRSGGQVLERLLSVHPLVESIGEDSLFNGYLPEIRNAIIEVTKKVDHLDEVEELVNTYGALIVQQMMNKLGQWDSIRHSDINPNHLAIAPSKHSVSTVKEYSSTVHIIDRMLFNFKNIGFIHLLYPKAPIVHIIRDPMDTILSIYKTRFDDAGLAWNTDLNDVVFEYVTYLHDMAHWRNVLPNRIIEIRYDKLITHTVTELKSLFHALKLDYSKDIEDQWRSILNILYYNCNSL